METVGKRIRVIREAAGYNESTVAAFLNISTCALEKTERGECVVKAEQLEKLSDLFGCNHADFCNPDMEIHPIRFEINPEILTTDSWRAVSKIVRIARNSEYMERLLDK